MESALPRKWTREKGIDPVCRESRRPEREPLGVEVKPLVLLAPHQLCPAPSILFCTAPFKRCAHLAVLAKVEPPAPEALTDAVAGSSKTEGEAAAGLSEGRLSCKPAAIDMVREDVGDGEAFMETAPGVGRRLAVLLSSDMDR